MSINEVAHSFPFAEGWPTEISEPADFFLRSWLKMRRGNLVPRKRDIEPIYMMKLLPMIWMYEYLPEEDDYICLLHGEIIREAWGFSLRGKRASEFTHPDLVEKMKARWHRVRQTPAILHSVMSHPTEDSRAAERIATPISDDDGNVRYLLGLSLYADLNVELTNLGPRGDTTYYYTIRRETE